MPTLFNGCGFDPPSPFTVTSIWSWIGHPVSGLRLLTFALFTLGFPAAPDLKSLALPVHAARRTVLQKVRGRSFIIDLPQLVNTGFQVLFHSPTGVLFTFPSQYFFTIAYHGVFRLGGWSPRLPTGFLVSRGTLVLYVGFGLSHTRLLLSLVPAFHPFILLDFFHHLCTVLNPIEPKFYGLASSAFARHYLRNLV